MHTQHDPNEDTSRKAIAEHLRVLNHSLEAHSEAIEQLKSASGITLSYQELQAFLSGQSLAEITDSRQVAAKAKADVTQTLQDLPPMYDKLYYTLDGKKHGPLRYPHIAKRYKKGEIPRGTQISRNAIFSIATPLPVEDYVARYEKGFTQDSLKNAAILIVFCLGIGIYFFSTMDDIGKPASPREQERARMQREYERLNSESSRLSQEMNAARARGEKYPDPDLARRVENNIQEMNELTKQKLQHDGK